MSDGQNVGARLGGAACSPPAGFSDPADFARMRDLLSQIGFNEREIGAISGPRDPSLTLAAQTANILRRTRVYSPLSVFVRLFLLGEPAPIGDFERAVKPITVDACVEAGLVEATGSEIVARVRLAPFRGLWLASDLLPVWSGCMPADFVTGVGPGTRTLANMIVKQPVRCALDLGSGCGSLSLLAAGFSERVWAADISERAMAYARFNCALNAVSNVTFCTGNMFEPVDATAFDLIVSNPPFVISPESTHVYRDSDLPLDTVCRNVVRESAARLAEGGYCQLLSNWAEIKGEDWRDRLRSWTEGIGCDAWIIRNETQPAEIYAAVWIEQEGRLDPIAFRQTYEKWMGYFDSERAIGVGAGSIHLRKRSGSKNWVRIEEGPDQMLGPCAEVVERGFVVRDLLESCDDQQILDITLQASDRLSLDMEMRPAMEGWIVAQTKLRLRQGFGYNAMFDGDVTNVVSLWNSPKTAGELLGDALNESPESAHSPAREWASAIRELVAMGFLVPCTDKSY